ncbi:hypothetical protein [Paenibacillus chitinolyticus]|nr:hypothetical protein [Paenibacillus chitinolyticus]
MQHKEKSSDALKEKASRQSRLTFDILIALVTLPLQAEYAAFYG